MNRISFYTFGCKVNQIESRELVSQFCKLGFKIVGYDKPADIFIFNFCSVTKKAENQCWQKVRSIIVKNPSAKIYITGCLMEQKIKAANIFYLKKEKILNRLKNIIKESTFRAEGSKQKSLKQKRYYNKTRGFIKVQDGCKNFCTYCIVPYLRNKLKSKKAAAVVKEIKNLEKEGLKEVVISGIHLSLWQDSGFRLKDLIKKIFEETKIPRIRISSLHPNEVTSEFLNLFKNPRFCRHLHLSIQNGSNRILKLMGRHYTKKQILDLIKKIRKIDHNFGISADIIVGFPGETEKDFEQTLDLVKKAEFSRVHIFKYSKRPGTLAEKMPNQVDKKTKEKRFWTLKRAIRKTALSFNKKQIGKILPVFFEQRKEGYWLGYSPNYSLCKAKSQKNLQGKILAAKGLKAFSDYLIVGLVKDIMS